MPRSKGKPRPRKHTARAGKQRRKARWTKAKLTRGRGWRFGYWVGRAVIFVPTFTLELVLWTILAIASAIGFCLRFLIGFAMGLRDDIRFLLSPGEDETRQPPPSLPSPETPPAQTSNDALRGNQDAQVRTVIPFLRRTARKPGHH